MTAPLDITDLKALKSLTHKQRRFVLAYVFDTNGNRTKAARRAGYSGKDDNSLAAEGSRLLRNVKVSTAIRALISRVCMPDVEALAILARIARGTFEPFLNVTLDGRVTLDLSTPQAKRNVHLLKKVKQKRRIIPTKDGDITEIETEVELHDAKDAAKEIAKLANVGEIDHQQLSEINISVITVEGGERRLEFDNENLQMIDANSCDKSTKPIQR